MSQPQRRGAGLRDDFQEKRAAGSRLPLQGHSGVPGFDSRSIRKCSHILDEFPLQRNAVERETKRFDACGTVSEGRAERLPPGAAWGAVNRGKVGCNETRKRTSMTVTRGHRNGARIMSM